MVCDKMIISIHQPQYLPWNGYFDKIKQSDIFVFLDDVQYKKNEWQNRNKIKTKNGIQWITVPVLYKFGQKIKDIEINQTVRWADKHIKTIEQTYKCKDQDLWKILKNIILINHKYLSDLNCEIVECISNFLNLKTVFYRSSKLGIEESDPDDRIIKIVEKLKGNLYIAGSGGRNYMDLSKYPFEVKFQEYKEDLPLSIINSLL